jgi:hypothetical protein
MSGLNLHSIIVNQAVVPGLLLYRREKRALLRRWRRAMILPETVMLVGLVMFGGFLSSHDSLRAGQAAMAAVNSAAKVETTLARPVKYSHDRVRHDIESLLSMTASDVISIFNQADLQRQDGDVTVMQFRGQDCVLDVYMRGGHAVHYELRPRNADDEPVLRSRSCVDDILKSRL